MRFKQQCCKLTRDWSVSLCSWNMYRREDQRNSNGLIGSPRICASGGKIQGRRGDIGVSLQCCVLQVVIFEFFRVMQANLEDIGAKFLGVLTDLGARSQGPRLSWRKCISSPDKSGSIFCVVRSSVLNSFSRSFTRHRR